METTPPTQRYTTNEIARRLHCGNAEAVKLLKAAGTRYSRCGPAYLWDGSDVDRLLIALQPKVQVQA